MSPRSVSLTVPGDTHLYIPATCANRNALESLHRSGIKALVNRTPKSFTSRSSVDKLIEFQNSCLN